MRRRRFSSTQWIAVRRRKRQLIERDPAATQLVDLIVKRYHRNKPGSGRLSLRWRRACELRDRLSVKYNVPVHILDPDQVREFRARSVDEAWLRANAWALGRPVTALDAEAPWKTATNLMLPEGRVWHPDLPLRVTLPSGRRTDHGARRETLTFKAAKTTRDGRSPILTFTVDLRKITQWDLETVAEEFRQRLHQARRLLPDSLRLRRGQRRNTPLALLREEPDGTAVVAHVDLGSFTTPMTTSLVEEFKRYLKRALQALPASLRIPSARRAPAALAFLPSVSDANFDRYVRWYDLCVTHGFSFRQVAAYEAPTKEGARSGRPSRRRIGYAIRGEDTVEKAVKLIYRAIHRKAYRHRRRRLAEPNAAVPEPVNSLRHPPLRV
jgi:hypothetical protein